MIEILKSKSRLFITGFVFGFPLLSCESDQDSRIINDCKACKPICFRRSNIYIGDSITSIRDSVGRWSPYVEADSEIDAFFQVVESDTTLIPIKSLSCYYFFSNGCLDSVAFSYFITMEEYGKITMNDILKHDWSCLIDEFDEGARVVDGVRYNLGKKITRLGGVLEILASKE